MRSIFISFAIAILFSGLFVYLLDNLSPITESGYEIVENEFGVNTQENFVLLIPEIRRAGILSDVLNMGNIIAMGIVVWLVVASTFSTIHLFIDKMFFKEFYKQPDWDIALRRSIIFSSLILVVLYLRILGYLNIPLLILLSVIVGLIELLFLKSKKILPKETNEILTETDTAS
jgi:hypothetical protein